MNQMDPISVFGSSLFYASPLQLCTANAANAAANAADAAAAAAAAAADALWVEIPFDLLNTKMCRVDF